MSTATAVSPPPVYAHWSLPAIDPEAARDLARSASLPPVLASLLLARGLSSADAVARFLRPTLDDLIEPAELTGLARASGRVQRAIADREPVLIYGDYDVDGTIAIVLLKTAIELLGGIVRYHVPHRLREGYGMQAEVLARASAEGVGLVISVDNGIRAFAAAESAAALGLDLIVTDHHLPDADAGLPPAYAVVNPSQPGCSYPCKHLCGAGVAFKLAQALLEAAGRERARERLLPSFLKMVVIATVADAVPLLGENRAIAALGIAGLSRSVNPGLRALLSVAGLDPASRPLTSSDIAFRLAPRINAAGRMDVASDVVELFTTRDAERARELAEKLDRLNSERRAAEASILEQIDEQIDRQMATLPGGGAGEAGGCLVLEGEGWHRGVLGILASRVVERCGRPALVLSHEAGEAHGSGRSIPGFHLLEALEGCRDVFLRFGGHAHAAGFSLQSGRVAELRQRLAAHASSRLTPAVLARTLDCSAELPLGEADLPLYRALCQMQPYGMGNEEPVFVARGVLVDAPPVPLGREHIRLRVREGSTVMRALGWRWFARCEALSIREGSCIDLAYRLRLNEHPAYGGLELEIVDLRPAAP